MSGILNTKARMHQRPNGSFIMVLGDAYAPPFQQFDFYGSEDVADHIVKMWNSYASSQAEIEMLRAALEPFAACAAIFDFGSATRPSLDGDGLMSWNDHRVEGERGFTVGDLRRARAALSGSKE